MVISLVLAVKNSETDFLLPFKRTDFFKFAAAFIFIVIMVLLSGIGNVFWQNNDHATRNTIFDILVNYSWPPKNNETALVYYIGFWLPSALVGKMFSLEAGYVFQIIWASLGLMILWYLLCLVHKKIVVYPLVIFMFFSGLDIFGHGIVNTFFYNLNKFQIGQWAFTEGGILTYHLEWWARYFQYSSHTTQLFWVFNQCLPVWIATVLIILEKNNKNLVFIMGLTLLSSTLPFVGLIPIFIWCAVTNKPDGILIRSFTQNAKKSFLELFTFQNVAGGGISGIISFLYLRGNIASGATSSQAENLKEQAVFSPWVFIFCIAFGILVFALLRYKTENKAPLLYLLPILPVAYFMAKLPMYKIEYYILFIIFEVLITSAAVFPVYGTSTLYALTVSCLMVIPFFTVGKSIDFCMRASIPLLVVLCIFSSTALEKYVKEKKTALLICLCAVLMFGAVNSFHEIARTIEATYYEIITKGKVVNDSKTVDQVFKGKNFTGKTENNIFYEILAK